MGAKSRRKGCVAERELAELIRSHGFHARRGRQYHGREDAPDIAHDIPGVYIECKRVEHFRLYAALEKAKSERLAGDIAVVFHRQNKRAWVAVLEATDLLVLLRELERATAPAPPAVTQKED